MKALRLCLVGVPTVRTFLEASMAQPKTVVLPQPPAFLTQERCMSMLLIALTKKMKNHLGSQFHEVRDDIRKQFKFTEEEAREMQLYVLQLSRIACNCAFDEFERRYSKQDDEE
jgi:hypothetical protein